VSTSSGQWVERLTLANFRSYTALDVTLGPEPIVLTGPNGAGKTNLMEAVSLLAPGPGLRRAPYADMARIGSTGDWTISALVHSGEETVRIGTTAAATGRIVRIDGENRSPAALAEHVEVLWLTPAMDGLFTGPASERRRFLDKLIAGFDPSYRTRMGHFERAMRQRNKALEDGASATQLNGLELQMAEMGVAIAAARREALAQLVATIASRRAAAPESPFPWADLALEGRLEDDLATRPAVDVEDAYARTLRDMRPRDRAAGRTLEGPHLSDLIVGHGPKTMPARLSSTGEQKALLINLILGHAALLRERRGGLAPILLLDEIAAHLDTERRAALFAELLTLGSQAWLTGTDPEPFQALDGDAHFLDIAKLLGTSPSA
jgi:DNA replication and repair protein RecF